MQKWKTLNSEYIFKTPFGNLRKDSCELPNGEIIQDYYVNEYSDWVNAIVVTKENKIVLVNQFRYAGQEFFIEIPAGKAEVNETYTEAILREVREETGYITETEPILLGEFFINPSTQNNKVISYLILDANHAFEQELDSTEFIEIKLADIDEVFAKIKNGEINQLFTVSAFYLALQHLTNLKLV
ncbi:MULTISPECIES: NUDIX hydrolase [unclassified Bacillus (in: firmicutes)]|uniref:NUDIX hydrolase n=1 Tax=unclassified Bacillus (in: firmicutes) TaxID=185979 RepID=UPI000BF0D5E3|nr:MULTISPECIES: NUDIX hydrolase [unclassified Bacillus (in: firmicutes)]PEJ57163.1 ADP-ribose pyrophosphatase [Bacillus sp. AFS002410]PEL13728.1 ADP-ribose pyrophosphatase [Bacillus sp. AFS017336]